MGDLIPDPVTVAEKLTDLDAVRYVNAQRGFHNTGNERLKVHVQVDPSREEHVRSFLDGAGYDVEKGNMTDSGKQIVNGYADR
jgi:hypothetical protein